jgi:trk system potassium uptake protein TrkH
MLLGRRKFRSFFRLGETRLTLIAIAIATPVVAVVSLLPLYGSLETTLRISFFNIVSALTTTGFSTVSYTDWPAFAWFALILLMIIGGGAGSTAGGLKAGRVYLLIKQITWSVRRKFLPERMVNQPAIYKPEGKTILSQELYAESANYTLIYLACLFVGTMILSGCGYSLEDSLFEFTSALGTVGLSIGLQHSYRTGCVMDYDLRHVPRQA